MIPVALESASALDNPVSRINADRVRLKCNREKPCQNCTARDEWAACKYKGSRNGAAPIAHQEQEDPMKQRIDHLESLVKRLITQHHEVPPPPESVIHSRDSLEVGTKALVTPVPSDASDVACASTTVIDGVHSVYKGADDWYEVLQEVRLFFFSL